MYETTNFADNIKNFQVGLFFRPNELFVHLTSMSRPATFGLPTCNISETVNPEVTLLFQDIEGTSNLEGEGFT
jgi:hypothetical protein